MCAGPCAEQWQGETGINRKNFGLKGASLYSGGRWKYMQPSKGQNHKEFQVFEVNNLQ